LTKNTGFCFGVERAFEMCVKSLKERPGNYYMLGPLVHNEHVVEKLKDLGMRYISSVKEASEGTLIIPAHGAGPEVYQAARQKGLKIVDTTCPLVKKVQDLAKELQKGGYQVVIIGDKGHTEVASIQKSIGNRGVIVESINEVSKIKVVKPLGVVVQTTQNPVRVKEILKELKGKFKEIKVLNTLCPTVVSYQQGLKKLIKKVDLILVIGSKASANTMRLVEIAKNEKRPVYLVESDKLNEKLLKKISETEKIGIASGTSTPDWLIKGVIKRLEPLSVSTAYV